KRQKRKVKEPEHSHLLHGNPPHCAVNKHAMKPFILNDKGPASAGQQRGGIPRLQSRVRSLLCRRGLVKKERGSSKYDVRFPYPLWSLASWPLLRCSSGSPLHVV